MTEPTIAERLERAAVRFSLRALTIALLPAAIFGAAAAGLVLNQPAEYQTTSLLVIDNPLLLATSGSESTITSLDRLRSKYATLANTNAIAGRVADELDVGPGVVLTRTDVFAARATLTLAVVGRADDPEVAIRFASAMADEIVEYVEEEHEANEVPEINRFFFEVVQPATFAVKTAPSTTRATQTGLLAFVVVLGLAYLSIEVLTRRRRAGPSDAGDDLAAVLDDGVTPPPTA